MKEKGNEKNKILLIVLSLILMFFVGYVLFLMYKILFTDTDVDIIVFAIALIPIFIIAPVITKIAPSVNGNNKKDDKYTFDHNQDPNNPHNYDGSSNNDHYTHQQTPSDGFDNPNNNNYTYNNSGNENGFNQNPNQKPNAGGKKPVNKNLVPTIILVIVFIVFFAYQGGYLSFFNNSDPEGKWIYQMNEGETIGGVTNLTDYWYMEFYENGTLDIGWKNVDYPEESQGSGSWYVESGVIYVTIHYNYGDTVQAEFVIKSNQLVEYGTNIPSEYYRE